MVAGEGPKGGWQWHACLPTGKDQSRWLIRVGAGLDPSAPLSAHLLRWLVKQVLLSAQHASAVKPQLRLGPFASPHMLWCDLSLYDDWPFRELTRVHGQWSRGDGRVQTDKQVACHLIWASNMIPPNGHLKSLSCLSGARQCITSQVLIPYAGMWWQKVCLCVYCRWRKHSWSCSRPGSSRAKASALLGYDSAPFNPEASTTSCVACIRCLQ